MSNVAAAGRRPAALGSVSGLVRSSFRLAREADRRLLRTIVALQVLRAGAIAAQVLLVQSVLQGLLSLDDGEPDATLLVLSLAALTAAVAVASTVTSVLSEQQRLLGELTVRSVWARILAVTGAAELEAFETPEFYDRLQRVESQAVMRPNLVVQSLVSLLGGLAGAVGASVALLAIAPWLLPLVAIGALPGLLAARQVSRMEYRFALQQTPRIRLRDYFSGVVTSRDAAAEVRAYGLADELTRRYRRINDEFLAEFRRYLRQRATIMAAGGVGASIALAVAVGVVAFFVLEGQLDVAAAGAAVVGARLLGQQVTGLVGGAQAIVESRPFVQDLHEFLEKGRALESMSPGARRVDSRSEGFDLLTLDRVSYRYPGADRMAVDGVSLDLRRDEVVALVGENGSGKTTLAKVMTGLLPATEGVVCYDGRPVSDVGPSILRRTAVVFQDFVRYQATARDNIAFGDVTRSASDPHVMEAAEQAGASEFAARLPNGYDTMLSKAFGDGVDLSTGMWQRLALARAFFRDPSFLLLDEPAAALDARAEHALFATIRGLATGRTVLFVSHRFATVRDADRIVVMHQGRVVEHGDHDSLMAAGGRYAEMFRLQASAYARTDDSRARSTF